MSSQPRAVWTGSIRGVRVAVLEDGRRVVEADGVATMLDRLTGRELDVDAFARELSAFMAGETLR